MGHEGGSGRWQGYVMSTKVIFNQAEVCLLLGRTIFFSEGDWEI